MWQEWEQEWEWEITRMRTKTTEIENVSKL